jgi:hypothetical protein
MAAGSWSNLATTPAGLADHAVTANIPINPQSDPVMLFRVRLSD